MSKAEITLPFYAGVALAALAFMLMQGLADRHAKLRRVLPVPILAGLTVAVLLLLSRGLGLGVTIPRRGPEVDFLVALLTTNMGLHLTPTVLRNGLPSFAVFLMAGAGLYGLQLAAALPVALFSAHPLETAVMTGPLAYLGAPYNLNPPAQVPPVADLLRPAFADPEKTAHGMMMLGVLLGPLLASWSAHRFFRRAGVEPPKPPARERETPSVGISDFAARQTQVLAIILVLVTSAFAVQALLLAAVPGFQQDHLPVIVISYLLGGIARLSFERLTAPGRFPEAALTALLLGPTMSIVLTYAVMSVPLHQIAAIRPAMALGGVAAMVTSVVLGWVLLPLFSKIAGRYDGAVISTVFIAATTAWGPLAMAFLRRSTQMQGEAEPMPAILPLNAFYLFPWMVIALTHAVFAIAG